MLSHKVSKSNFTNTQDNRATKKRVCDLFDRVVCCLFHELFGVQAVDMVVCDLFQDLFGVQGVDMVCGLFQELFGVQGVDMVCGLFQELFGVQSFSGAVWYSGC